MNGIEQGKEAASASAHRKDDTALQSMRGAVANYDHNRASR